MDRRELIQELRVRVGAVRTDAVALPGLSIGVEEIDEHLPGGGLARGALHEFVGGDDDLQHGAAPALLAATVLGREGKAVLWVVSREDLFPAGIAGGLEPGTCVEGGASSAIASAEDCTPVGSICVCMLVWPPCV